MTARCNLKCSYCYVNHNGDDMTMDTTRAVVDLAGRDSKRAGIIFFGGEPLLLRSIIYDTVAYARSKEKESECRYFFKITTNGLLLDDDFIDFARREGLFIALSVDGTKKAHNKHRKDSGGNGSFDKVVSAARRLLAVKPYSPVLMTIHPDTLSEFAAGVQYLFSLGFSYVIASLDYSADWREENLPELERQYKLLAKLYEQKTLAEDKFYFSPFEVKISSHVNSKTYCQERCELGLRQLSVGPDGTIYPCVQFVGDPQFALGNVFDGVNNDARQALYTRNEEEKPGCDICAIRSRCNHYCACLNRQATGSIDKVSPMLCAHERIVLPIADDLAERLYEKGNALFIQKQYNDFYPLLSLAEDSL
ncbi:MAG: radical SAM protein [Oscillospiraceae bacterium]|nr:radical SAM protein [Oscillospiraceae bacterium]